MELTDWEQRYIDLLRGPRTAERDEEFIGFATELLGQQAEVDDLDVPEAWYELARAHSRMGAHDEAIRAMQTALEVGWDPVPDGRCDLATVLVAADRVEEAYELHAAVKADTPDDVWLYNSAAMDCLDAGDPERALEWLTEGINLALDTGDAERLVDQLADLRHAALEQLGRPADDLQVKAETSAAEQARRRGSVRDASQAEESLLHGDASSRASTSLARSERSTEPGFRVAMALSWFRSAEEFEGAVEAWPEFAAAIEARDFASYCRLLEGHLKRYAMHGPKPSISPMTVEGLRAYAAEHGLHPDTPQARSQMAAELARRGETLAWPPGRNDPCWCGSARKYKKCCDLQPPAPETDEG